MLFILYKTHTVINLILARTRHKIGYFTAILPLFRSLSLSCFAHITCILHHLAFLVCRQLAIISPPITHFQTLKTHFLRVILPFFVMYFMVREGFIYTISVDIYAFRPAFSGKSHCILHHFTLRLAPKRVAFSGKTQCILHQNALRFSAYCTIFSSKWPLKQCKWQFLQINIHFVNVHLLPLFASKQTFARIDFLRPSG